MWKLADAAALKKLATDYMHYEVEAIAVKPSAFGRNTEECVQILTDAAAKVATDYMYPEIEVIEKTISPGHQQQN